MSREGPQPTLSRRQALKITAVAGLTLAMGGGLTRALLERAGVHRIRRTRTQLGTQVTVTVVHPDAAAARSMVEGTFAEIERLEGLLSRHRPETPVSRLRREGFLPQAPPELIDVLGRGQELSSRTGGAFDVTVAPLLDLYRTRASEGRDLPSRREVEESLALVDYRRIRVEKGAVSLERPGMAITLDGIAKGYVVDRAVATLVGLGAGRVLVEAGGDLATAGDDLATGGGGPTTGRDVAGAGGGPDARGGDPSTAGGDPSAGGEASGGTGGVGRGEGDGWAVAVQDPHDPGGSLGVLRLHGQAVASSGDYVQAFTEDRRHHHILDPRTGASPDHTSGVTVVAPSAMDADALSTAVFVLGPGEGLALLEGLERVEGLIVSKDGRRMATRGFGRPPAGPGWGRG